MRARPIRSANSLPLTLATGPSRMMSAAVSGTETDMPTAPPCRLAAYVRKATSHARVACSSHECAAIANR